MPMIEVTTAAGVLSAEARTLLQRRLGATVLKWENTPETELFRALTWIQVNETPSGAFVTLGDEQPRFRVEVTVPAGTLDDERKQGLVEDLTARVLDAAGLSTDDGLRVWVLIHDLPDGNWAAAGRIVRLAELNALEEAERAHA